MGTIVFVQIDYRRERGVVVNRYKELFPRKQLYNTQAQLRKELKDLCLRPEKVRSLERRKAASEHASQYLWKSQKKEWDKVL